jgi:hypothetical protein
LRQDFTRGDRCPRLQTRPTDFISKNRKGTGYWYSFFFRPRVRGSQGTNRIDLRHHQQTRFIYARIKRSQPQFKAHNSVRPFENGLRLGGSSATRHESESAVWPVSKRLCELGFSLLGASDNLKGEWHNITRPEALGCTRCSRLQTQTPAAGYICITPSRGWHLVIGSHYYHGTAHNVPPTAAFGTQYSCLCTCIPYE